MKLVERALGELGVDLVLAPERWLSVDRSGGVALSELVRERRERAPAGLLVVDTTHARDGILDLVAAGRQTGEARSAKRLARAGDVVVSRLRPYLRQVAYVHPAALAAVGVHALALSTEYYVLAPAGEQSIAFLLPLLLGRRAQTLLSGAQEGGHHPRVPRSSLLSLRIPKREVQRRIEVSAEVERALDATYRALAAWHGLVRRGSGAG